VNFWWRFVLLTLDFSEPSSLFALLIGINKYESTDIHNLDGAVPDVQAMKTYLKTKLGVPSSNIKTLLDEHATRDAIINSLRALKANDKIKSVPSPQQSGDAILIFYAGHGGTAEAPDGWEASGPTIQVLVAYDSETVRDGHTIKGIPDRTIGVLLEEIAEVKGDNIVCLFYAYEVGADLMLRRLSSLTVVTLRRSRVIQVAWRAVLVSPWRSPRT
jgi:hypothetical protein